MRQNKLQLLGFVHSASKNVGSGRALSLAFISPAGSEISE